MKEKRVEGCTIIINVDDPWFLGNKTFAETGTAYVNAARSIIQDIKRHVDDCDNIEYELKVCEYCSFCDREWQTFTEEDEKVDPEYIAGMPTCCEKAQEEWMEQNKHD